MVNVSAKNFSRLPEPLHKRLVSLLCERGKAVSVAGENLGLIDNSSLNEFEQMRSRRPTSDLTFRRGAGGSAPVLSTTEERKQLDLMRAYFVGFHVMQPRFIGGQIMPDRAAAHHLTIGHRYEQ